MARLPRRIVVSSHVGIRLEAEVDPALPLSAPPPPSPPSPSIPPPSASSASSARLPPDHETAVFRTPPIRYGAPIAVARPATISRVLHPLVHDWRAPSFLSSPRLLEASSGVGGSGCGLVSMPGGQPPLCAGRVVEILSMGTPRLAIVESVAGDGSGSVTAVIAGRGGVVHRVSDADRSGGGSGGGDVAHAVTHVFAELDLVGDDGNAAARHDDQLVGHERVLDILRRARRHAEHAQRAIPTTAAMSKEVFERKTRAAAAVVRDATTSTDALASDGRQEARLVQVWKQMRAQRRNVSAHEFAALLHPGALAEPTLVAIYAAYHLMLRRYDLFRFVGAGMFAAVPETIAELLDRQRRAIVDRDLTTRFVTAAMDCLAARSASSSSSSSSSNSLTSAALAIQASCFQPLVMALRRFASSRTAMPIGETAYASSSVDIVDMDLVQRVLRPLSAVPLPTTSTTSDKASARSASASSATFSFPKSRQMALRLLLELNLAHENENMSLLRAEYESELFEAFPTALTPEITPRAIQSRGGSVDGLDDARVVFDAPCVAVDSSDTSEVDDALSVSGAWIHVHVSDPTRHFAPHSPIDLALRRRVTSIYLPERRHAMMPGPWTTGLSLLDTDRSHALTFSARLDPHTGRPLEYRVTPSVLPPVRRMTYEQVDDALAAEQDVLLGRLHDVARLRRQLRASAGAQVAQLPSPRVKLLSARPATGEDELALDVHVDQLTPARILVEEMMILAGEIAAEFGYQHGLALMYRHQPERVTAPVVVAPDASAAAATPSGSSGRFDWLVEAYRQSTAGGGAAYSATPRPHRSVGLDRYTRTTSPLRRYPDIVNHFQIKATLRSRAAGRTQPPPFSVDDIERLRPNVEDVERQVHVLQLASDAFWLRRYYALLFAKDPQRLLRGVVVDVRTLALPAFDNRTVRVTVILGDVGGREHVRVAPDVLASGRVAVGREIWLAWSRSRAAFDVVVAAG